MSSHHIVRDAQEPALVIASTAIPFEILGQLLEWSPVVVVFENCLDEVLSWDIKIDIIICQSTHYENILNTSAHQQPLQIFQVDGSETVDFLHFAIKYLIKSGHDAISIVRNDFAPKDFEKYIDKTELIVYQGDNKSYFAKKGIFKKWVTANTTFYFSEKEQIKNVCFLQEVSPHLYQATQTGIISFEVSETIFVTEN